MGHRSEDLRDGTLHDITHICTTMEQLLLSYKQGETPYIYITNLLELLFQSARTRICILREAPSYDKKTCATDVVGKLVVFTTFRKHETYNSFLKQLSSRLLKHKKRFLENECEHLNSEDSNLYICLARIPPGNKGVVIDRSHSKEAYHRLSTLLRLLAEDTQNWGLDMHAELHRCFSNIPNTPSFVCKQSCHTHTTSTTPLNLAAQPPDLGKSFPHEDYLKPIYDWVSYIYTQHTGTPLVQVAHPDSQQEAMGFSNLFFFVKVNNQPESSNGDHHCDSFAIRLVCPPQQQTELSRYYHKHRGGCCQWYKTNGLCKIHGMGNCLFQQYWDTLPEQDDVNDDTLIEHYAPIWEKLSAVTRSDYSKSEAAFRSSSILFDRRQRKTLNSGDKARVDGASERDRVAACITYRMMTPITEGGNCEDQVPQIMFVPLYA